MLEKRSGEVKEKNTKKKKRRKRNGTQKEGYADIS
jgi:hypothetical protein